MTIPPFDRTVCVCSRCLACCARPAPLIPDDLVRIARFRHQEVEDLLLDLQPGRGAIVVNVTTGRMLRIPTLAVRGASQSALDHARRHARGEAQKQA